MSEGFVDIKIKFESDLLLHENKIINSGNINDIHIYLENLINNKVIDYEMLAEALWLTKHMLYNFINHYPLNADTILNNLKWYNKNNKLPLFKLNDFFLTSSNLEESQINFEDVWMNVNKYSICPIRFHNEEELHNYIVNLCINDKWTKYLGITYSTEKINKLAYVLKIPELTSIKKWLENYYPNNYMYIKVRNFYRYNNVKLSTIIT